MSRGERVAADRPLATREAATARPVELTANSLHSVRHGQAELHRTALSAWLRVFSLFVPYAAGPNKELDKPGPCQGPTARTRPRD